LTETLKRFRTASERVCDANPDTSVTKINRLFVESIQKDDELIEYRLDQIGGEINNSEKLHELFGVRPAEGGE
jgi:hypothetical protein